MTRFIAALALSALTACTVAPPERGPVAEQTALARPVSAILYPQALNVIYDDGALCAATRPIAQPIWGAALSGCPHQQNFTVEELRSLSAARLPLRAGEGGPGAQVKLAVVLADGSLVHFTAP